MFNLTDYVKDIQTMATDMHVSVEVATQKFIENLALLRDQWPVANKSLNFRAMGQQWNQLTSSVRNAQKAATIAQASRTSRRVAE